MTLPNLAPPATDPPAPFWPRVLAHVHATATQFAAEYPEFEVEAAFGMGVELRVIRAEFDNGSADDCAWAYIEQALGVWDLVRLIPGHAVS